MLGDGHLTHTYQLIMWGGEEMFAISVSARMAGLWRLTLTLIDSASRIHDATAVNLTAL